MFINLKKLKLKVVIMKKLIPIFLILLTLTLCACSSTTYSESFYAMNTYMSITVNCPDSKNVVKEAKNTIVNLDKTLSAFNKTSDIYKLNEKGSADISTETAGLLKDAVNYSKLTNGAFNPALLKVTKLWGFPDKKYRIPSDKELKEALDTAKPDKIDINGYKVSLNQEGMEVDLGAIAKGFASQKITDSFKSKGVNSALINLGGNVQTIGTKDGGNPWLVAIKHPEPGKQYLGQLKVKDKAVVSSGQYERNFKKNGKTYGHILNPENGYPAQKGLLSTTVIYNDAVFADAMSTALYVMGEKDALKFWANSKENFDIVFYSEKGEILVSEGAAESFSSDYKYKVIKKSDYE